jgi:hypothetical protein
MNCPNCGAENDADARFCAECGTPLDQPDADETIAGRVDLADSDMTMISTRPDLAAQEKTMRVDQEQLAAAAEAGTAASTSEPVPPPPGDVPRDVPRESYPSEPGNLGGIQSNRNLWIVIGVILILMLCCCCASIFIGIAFAPEIEQYMGQLVGLTGAV